MKIDGPIGSLQGSLPRPNQAIRHFAVFKPALASEALDRTGYQLRVPAGARAGARFNIGCHLVRPPALEPYRPSNPIGPRALRSRTLPDLDLFARFIYADGFCTLRQVANQVVVHFDLLGIRDHDSALAAGQHVSANLKSFAMIQYQ